MFIITTKYYLNPIITPQKNIMFTTLRTGAYN